MMSTWKAALAGLTMAAVAGAPALAQSDSGGKQPGEAPQPPQAQQGQMDPAQMVPGFTPDVLVGVLGAMGYRTELRTLEDGTTAVRAQSPEGIILFLEPRACNSGTCVGLQYRAFFRRDEPYTLQDVNLYNQRYAFMKSILLEDGRAYLGRYIIADYGIPLGNIAVNTSVFTALAAQFGEIVATGGGGGLEARFDADLPDSMSAMVPGGLTTSEPAMDMAHTDAIDFGSITDDMVNER